MKKLRRTISLKDPMPVGYAVYKWEHQRLAYGACLWLAYPFFRIPVLLSELKYKLYLFFNRIGLMQTPEGNVMTIKDINFRRFYENIRKR